MKITMYELLGMVKDGTQPKHIKYRGEEWWWGYDTYTYFADLVNSPDAQKNMFTRYDINYCLDDEVEILEEEKKIPEKLEEPRFNKGRYYIKDINGDDSEISGIERAFRLKINEIIDCLKSKGE